MSVCKCKALHSVHHTNDVISHVHSIWLAFHAWNWFSLYSPQTAWVINPAHIHIHIQYTLYLSGAQGSLLDWFAVSSMWQCWQLQGAMVARSQDHVQVLLPIKCGCIVWWAVGWKGWVKQLLDFLCKQFAVGKQKVWTDVLLSDGYFLTRSFLSSRFSHSRIVNLVDSLLISSSLRQLMLHGNWTISDMWSWQ